MSKFRAVIITGRLESETRKGPVRKERCNSYDDLAKLEGMYSPCRGIIVEEDSYEFPGEVDVFFDE